MKLEEFASVINKKIDLWSYPKPPWYGCSLHGAEMRVNVAGLLSNFGTGVTPNEARDEYVKLISGQLLIFDAMDECRRQEFNVPADLM
ncbi:MAG: hypothetical protein PHO67_08215 [Candidatus Omnitrophica bacterium]|nr:hypothetical protein [Candidatus Omnitrophota bacterium]